MYNLNLLIMKTTNVFSKVLFSLFIIVSLLTSCEPESTNLDDSSNDEPGVLDNNLLVFNANVYDDNTSNAIYGAVVEWEQVGTWAGSIVYPRSGTTLANGSFSVSFTVPTNITSWSLHVTRVSVPSGGYYSWSDGAVVNLQVNSPKTLTVYLRPI